MKEIVNQMAEHAVLLTGILVILILVFFLILLITGMVKRGMEYQGQIKEPGQMYGLISENSFQICITVRKEDMCPVFVSDNIDTILGLDKEDVLLDLSALLWIMEDEDKIRMEKLWKEWNREESFSVDCACFHYKTKEKKYMLFHVEEDQSKEYDIIFLQDIHKQKTAEFALRDQLDKAREENRAKTEFLSKMSHEIRTPMNGILGMLELAKMDMNQKDKVAEYLDKANHLSQFLLSLINDILDLTRIESGKTELVCEPFDLYALAEKMRSMFQKEIQDKGIRFRIEMEDFDVHWVKGDEMRLSQVIINFLSNAVKFTESGGEISVIFRQMQKMEDRLRLMIQVRDTGKGIEPEFLNSIFKPFEQEDNKIARKYGGSGLGMTISDNIIRLMGGQIVIDSEVGKGSDFTVFLSLPLAKEKEQEERMEGNLNEDFLSEERLVRYLSGTHIMLAEDNDINARISMKLLEKDGMLVERVINGKEAVDTFKNSPEGHFDLILMDIQMPELNGWDATRQIRAMERKDAKCIPIYALSANAFVEDKRHSMEVGMNGHISKPIDFKELRRIIGTAIQENQGQDM